MARIAVRPSITPFLRASIGLHGLGAAALLAQRHSWEFVVPVLVANHLAVTAAAMTPRCGWLGANTTRIPLVDGQSRAVGLTFDDGPNPIVTPKVLELLAQADARATFFCIGQRAKAYPDIIAAMRQMGHGVENHTQSHPNSFALHGPSAMLAELSGAQRAIELAGGGVPTLFRAPAGMKNPWMATVLDRLNLSLVSWTRRGFDTVTHSGARVAQRLRRGLAVGDILLLHDGSSASDSQGAPVVLDALERILDALNKQGLQSEALHIALRTSPREPAS